MGELRPGIRRILHATGLYHRLEWSPMHRLYVRFNNPRYEANQRAERAFYGKLIARGALVFDIGANKGSKCETFLALGARVVAVEPDPVCVPTLRRRFVLQRRVEVVPAAVGAAPGTLQLLVHERGSAYNTLSPKWRDHRHGAHPEGAIPVEVTTLDALITRWGRPDFLKIDVEGFEREVLEGLSTPIACLSFEANLPIFRDETLDCIARLASLDAGYRFNTISDLAADWDHARWLDAGELASVLRASDEGYCEVFARRQ